MNFSLEVRRARKGDCLLLHYGTKADPRLMLIDAGPSSVYKPQLRPRLDEIRKKRKLTDNDSLPVDVVMVSHIDDDHIKGIIDLTTELRNQESNHEAQYLTSKSLWHNSFDDLLKTTPPELDQAGFGPASMAASIDAEALDGDDLSVLKVLASVPQGRALRDDAEFLRKAGHGWDVNDVSKGSLILADKKTKAKKLDGGINVTIVGPMVPELAKLQKDHDKYLKAKKLGQKTTASLLAAYVDESVANLSSIVVMVEAGKKTILLTGDARGDKVLEGLRLTGLLGPGPKAKLKIDVLKVPHHGSSNNMETAFFTQVIADHYVFSGDGEHGNPERETLEMLLKARSKDSFTMYFTYPIDKIDVDRQKDWEKEQKKEKKKGKKARPDWKPATNSLKALLAKDDATLHKIKVIEKDAGSHLIELLDEIKF
jgi:beta-lactamase superfamily II metal-dependent hydrolase